MAGPVAVDPALGARHHQRSGLRELAEQDDPLLRDMGIPRDKALIEAAKPFWKR
ncbi:hypothetical protein AAII07_33805 [Microvirga sp. 0TCS3.31]